MYGYVSSFNRRIVSKTSMFVLETILRLKVLTAVGKQVFEILNKTVIFSAKNCQNRKSLDEREYGTTHRHFFRQKWSKSQIYLLLSTFKKDLYTPLDKHDYGTTLLVHLFILRMANDRSWAPHARAAALLAATEPVVRWRHNEKHIAGYP